MADKELSKKAERRQRTIEFLASEDSLEDLFAHISAGQSLRDYCVVKDMPYSTVQSALRGTEALEARYQAALDARSDLQRDKIEEIVEQVERGDIDPKAAAVAIGGRQWLAKVMNRKRYGDQQVVDVAVTDKTRLHLEALRLLARRPRAQVEVAQVPPVALPVKELDAIEAAFEEIKAPQDLDG